MVIRHPQVDPGMPLGWRAVDGLLQPDPTIAGHLARGQEVKGVCHQRDCRRRCDLDLGRLEARGFGSLPVAAAQGLMRCHSLAGCALEFHVEPKSTLRLGDLLGRSHVRVRIKCGGCGFFRVAPPEAVIAKLTVGDTRGGAVAIGEIAGTIRGPCRRCGKSAWVVDVLWPDPNSEGARRHPGPG